MSSYDGDENPIFSDGWFRRSDGNTIYQNVVERCVGTGDAVSVREEDILWQ